MPEPATRITSLQNDRVKFIRSLEMRKARRASGLFVAEGASLLITARDNGWTPKTLVTGPAADASDAARGLTVWAHKAGAECLEVSAAVLEKLASKDNPQSLMGVFEQRWAALPDGKAPEQVGAAVRTAKANAASVPLWLALEEIRDPGNLGTIIRTADAAGVSGIILAGQTCDPYSHEAVRASMGSIFFGSTGAHRSRRIAGSGQILARRGRGHASLRQRRLSRGALSSAGAADHGQ